MINLDDQYKGIGLASIGAASILSSGSVRKRAIRETLRASARRPVRIGGGNKIMDLWRDALGSSAAMTWAPQNLEKLLDESKLTGKNRKIIRGPHGAIITGVDRSIPSVLEFSGKSGKYFGLVVPQGRVSGEILLHEIGHSVVSSRYPELSRMSVLSRRLSKSGLVPPAFFVSGYLLGNKKDRHSIAALGAGAALAYGPTIIDEMMATRWANKNWMKLLPKHGIPAGFDKKVLRKAMASYLAGPLTALGAGLIGLGASKIIGNS